MSIHKLILAGFLSISYFAPVRSQLQDDPILQAIKSEVDRNKEGLHAGKLEPPFWISYRFLNASRMTVIASEGYLIYQDISQNNSGISDILVGNTQLNNNNFQSYYNKKNLKVGETNLESALKYAIWNQLDADYKKAAEDLEKKKTQITQQNIPLEDLKINDWDESMPQQYYQKQVIQKIDPHFWESYCRKASLALCKDTAIIENEFKAEIIQGDYYYYSTDGFMYRLPMRLIKLTGNVKCRTKDGQEMEERYCYYFDNLNDVIPIENLCTEILQYNKLLIEESEAPIIPEAYSGPVLYEENAVSEAVENCYINNDNGLMAKRKEISQTRNSGYSGNAENRIGQMMYKKVADRRLDFISMTGKSRWNGQKLLGYTPIDAQGVKPDSSFVLIENGILKNLLSNRTPTKTNPKSNGHSMFYMGSPETGLGIGVLRLKVTQGIPKEALKDSLLAAAKEEGYDFAYLYRGYAHMSGCFLYKVYTDGHEEMVRNFSINDLNQKQFKYILQFGAEDYVRNTITGENITTLIVPYGIIFKELEIIRNNNVTLNKPYIVARPERKK